MFNPMSVSRFLGYENAPWQKEATTHKAHEVLSVADNEGQDLIPRKATRKQLALI